MLLPPAQSEQINNLVSLACLHLCPAVFLQVSCPHAKHAANTVSGIDLINPQKEKDIDIFLGSKG